MCRVCPPRIWELHLPGDGEAGARVFRLHLPNFCRRELGEISDRLRSAP